MNFVLLFVLLSHAPCISHTSLSAFLPFFPITVFYLLCGGVGSKDPLATLSGWLWLMETWKNRLSGNLDQITAVVAYANRPTASLSPLFAQYWICGRYCLVAPLATAFLSLLLHLLDCAHFFIRSGAPLRTQTVTVDCLFSSQRPLGHVKFFLRISFPEPISGF